MGTCLYAVVEYREDPTPHRIGGWHHVCSWDFGKAYDLKAWLDDQPWVIGGWTHTRNWYPEVTSVAPEAMSLDAAEIWCGDIGHDYQQTTDELNNLIGRHRLGDLIDDPLVKDNPFWVALVVAYYGMVHNGLRARILFYRS